VITIVQNAIRIDPEFEAHVTKKGLTQKYWVLWFAEYLIEEIYPQPDLAKKKEHKAHVKQAG
jgi:hypothetical protein